MGIGGKFDVKFTRKLGLPILAFTTFFIASKVMCHLDFTPGCSFLNVSFVFEFALKIGYTPRGRATTRLLRRVLRRILKTAFEKGLRRVLRRCLGVGVRGRKGSEKGS